MLWFCGIEKYEKKINATQCKFIKRMKWRSKLILLRFFINKIFANELHIDK